MKYPVRIVSYTNYPGSLLKAKIGQIQVQINIDMYFDREHATSTDIYGALMSKAELQRDGLKQQII